MPEKIDAAWVKGLRAWVKKTFGPRPYSSVEEISVRYKQALNEDLPRLNQYLFMKKGLLPFAKEESLRTILDDLRGKVSEELKAARQVLEEGKSRFDFQVLGNTPGTWEASHRPDVLEFYANKPPGHFLKAVTEIANESFSEAEAILSGRLLRYVSNFLTKWSGGIPLETEEIITQFTLGGMKVVLNDAAFPSDRRRNARSISEYIPFFERARALLSKKGLGKLWYGVTLLDCSSCGGENPHGAHFGVGGHYVIAKDQVVIFSDPSSGIAGLLVHELGHRYYYKFMSRADRLRFDSYFQEVAATSDYGAKATEEDFAEVFRSYVMGKDLTRDQIERFRAFLAGEDRRRVFGYGFEEWLSSDVVSLLIRSYAKDDSLRWKYGDLPARTWGRYQPNEKTLIVNKAKTRGDFKQQVETILHEIQHWNQHLKWKEESGVQKENYLFGPSFSHEIKNQLDRFGYWSSPVEVEARAFAKKNLEGAIKEIARFYGGKAEGGGWNEVLEELVDLSEDSNGSLTRGQVGTILKEYDMNNFENLAKALKELRELGVRIASGA